MKRNVEEWEKHLGAQLKRARLDQNLSQAEVASRCGLSQLTVAKLEAGAGSRTNTLIKVMKVLGLESQLDMLVPARPISPIQIRSLRSVRQRAGTARRVKREDE